MEILDRRGDRSQPAPLIIAMDGFLGTARNMRRKTSFDTLPAEAGFIVAYVNGVGRRWNDGHDPTNGTDDVGYLAALITAEIERGRADPGRIFLTGHSNGGSMAMRMACERPDLVAGISVVATKVPVAYQCADGRPVPAIFFYGTADPVAPAEGRQVGHRLGGTLTAEESIALWARRNGCGGIGQRQVVDRVDDQTSAEIRQYSGCRARLIHVEITGHGHGWPGAGPELPRIQGHASAEIDAAALSLWFFGTL